MGLGRIIVMEGAGDGIGKTTQFKLLKKRLENDGEIVVTHHFPSYNTVQGNLIEEYLKGTYGNTGDNCPYLINAMFAMDRALFWSGINEENQGKTFLFDRYTTSSLIYQAADIKDLEERKEFIDYISDYEYNRLGVRKPDDVVFLYAPFDLITELRNKRKVNDGIPNDIHESDLEYMKRVYDNSLFLAEYLEWKIIDCTNNGRIDTIENISDKVYEYAKKR